MKRTTKRVVRQAPAMQPEAVSDSCALEEGLQLNIVLSKPVGDALRMRAESKAKTMEVYAAEVLTVALASYI